MKITTEIPVQQDIIVDVVESHLEVAYANQYDDNTSTIHCLIQKRGVDFNIENYTVTLRVKKSNGKGFSANIGSEELEGIVHDNVVSFKIPRYLTVSHGKQICNLEFFEKDHVENGIKYSCTFYLRVNKSALQEEDILDSDYYASVHDEYVKLKTDITDALTQEQERATQAENTISDNLVAHLDDKDNPHNITKTQLGLGSVEDKSSATIREEITKANVTDALGYTPYAPNEVDDKLSALDSNKVDKIDGKGLSTNDFTNDYKSSLDSISEGMVTGIKGNSESDYRTGNVNITKENIGLGNVGNFKAVSTASSQGLTDTEKSNARTNIGAQSSLGYTPVQQGGGSGQFPNKIYLGWTGTQLKIQVDNVDMGAIPTTSTGNNNAILPIVKGGTGATTAATARSNLGITPENIGALATDGGTMSGDITYGYNRIHKVDDNTMLICGSAQGVRLKTGSTSTAASFTPAYDRMTYLGDSNYKWNQVYSINSSISTSDKNEKHDISYIGEKTNYDTSMFDEQLEMLIMGIKPCVFKRNNGENGRPHHGIIAHDFEHLLKDIGLSDHAGFIKSPKTKQIEVDTGELDEDGNPIKKTEDEIIEGEYIYGFRYEELISDIIRFAQLQKLRADSLEEKLSKQEKEITEIKNILATNN